MKAMRRLRDIGIATAILALLALIVLRIGDPGGETIAGAARAADGDTLTLGGHRIRLIGIDAPEMAQAFFLPCCRSTQARVVVERHA